MGLRLLRIEIRHSIGLWLFAPILGLAWFYFDGDMAYFRTLLWVQVSIGVRNIAFFAAPCIAAAAAWMAGRERRRGSGELLTTMPQSPLSRHLRVLLATIIWGVAAYLLVALVLLTLTARRATWGGPTFWPALIGLLALSTYGALGFALGRVIPSRFTAPLVGVASFFMQSFVAYGSYATRQLVENPRFGWLIYLSPVVELPASPWYGIQPNIGWQQAAFLLGLGGLAIGAMALGERHTRAAWGLCGGAAILTVVGVVLIHSAAPIGTARERAAARMADPTAGLIPFTPVCAGESFPICVHPAYQPWLTENAVSINRVVAPLRAVPGAPLRGEQWSPLFGRVTTEVVMINPQPDVQASASQFVDQLLASPEYVPESWRQCPDFNSATGYQSCWYARDAIKIWLLRQGGFNGDLPAQSAAIAAAERFGALPETEQRAWLHANFAALRAGHVTLAMFP